MLQSILDQTGFNSSWATISKKDTFYHMIFWVSLFGLTIASSIVTMPWLLSVLTSLVSVCFFALICYFNFFVLFPKYLKDRNLFWHFGALGLASLLLTPIKTVFLYFICYQMPELRSSYASSQVYMFLSLFFVGTSTTIYKVMNEWLVQQKDKNELQSQTLKSELNFLKSQINPHFLFNTLNSLYALTLKKSDLAPEIVLKLSEMMRYMLYECNEKEVPLSKEINYMQNYLELEKLRHGSRMIIDFKIKGDAEDIKIAPLMLIPFIENSFKHGASNQVAPGHVDLDLEILPHQLVMHLENSKAPSLPKISDKKSGGIGLVNVKRRMEILYPGQHKLDIIESPNTYRIELSLTLSK
jgi:two-component system, LytTR family, sensor kinase